MSFSSFLKKSIIPLAMGMAQMGLAQMSPQISKTASDVLSDVEVIPMFAVGRDNVAFRDEEAQTNNYALSGVRVAYKLSHKGFIPGVNDSVELMGGVFRRQNDLGEVGTTWRGGMQWSFQVHPDWTPFVIAESSYSWFGRDFDFETAPFSAPRAGIQYRLQKNVSLRAESSWLETGVGAVVRL